MSLERIISGGQTGADQGGLEAAAILGLKTGGTMPRGFRTETGPRRDLAEIYNLVALNTSDYLTRTRLNICGASATVIFGHLTGGTKQTAAICGQELKPYVRISFPETCEVDLNAFTIWLKLHNPRILNVAGNRESKNPGIQVFTKNFLVNAINAIRGEP